jgi:hypothetical protein
VDIWSVFCCASTTKAWPVLGQALGPSSTHAHAQHAPDTWRVSGAGLPCSYEHACAPHLQHMLLCTVRAWYQSAKACGRQTSRCGLQKLSDVSQEPSVSQGTAAELTMFPCKGSATTVTAPECSPNREPQHHSQPLYNVSSHHQAPHRASA